MLYAAANLLNIFTTVSYRLKLGPTSVEAFCCRLQYYYTFGSCQERDVEIMEIEKQNLLTVERI